MSDKQQVVYNTTRSGIGPCIALFFLIIGGAALIGAIIEGSR